MSTVRAERSMNGIIRENTMRQHQLKVILKQDSYELNVVGLTAGQFNNSLAHHVKDSFKVNINGVLRSYENFNFGVIVIQVENAALGKFVKDGILIDYKASGTPKVYVIHDNKVIEADTGLELEDMSRVKKMHCYFTSVYSNSQEKDQENTCIRLDLSEGFEVGYKQAEEGLNKVSFGAYNNMKGKVVTQAQGVKMISRLSQSLAPSADISAKLGRDLVIAVYFSKDEIYSDGHQVIRAYTYSQMVAQKEKDVAGLLAQVRSMNADKGAASLIEDAHMEKLLSRKEVVYIDRSLFSEFYKEIETAFNGDKTSNLYGKIVVFGEKGQLPDILTNLNTLKALPDFSLAPNLPLLAVSGVKRRFVKLSMQMAQNLVNNTEDGADFYAERLSAQMKDGVSEFLNQQKRSVPTIEEVTKDNPYFQGAIEKAAYPWLFRYEKSAFRSLANSFLEGRSREISKFNIKFDGVFARGLVDPGYDFGYNLLAEDECFLKDATQYFNKLADEKYGIKSTYAKQVDRVKQYLKYRWSVAVARSPKPGDHDMSHLRVVSIHEMIIRIRKIVKEKDLQEILIQHFKNIGTGIIVLPVSPELLLLHSGADWDFDGYSVFFDQELVERSQKVGMVFRELVKEKEKESKDRETTFDNFL